MTNAPDYDLIGSLGYQVSLTARLLERNFESALKPLGLNRTNWTVLFAVSRAGISNPSQIADYIGIDRTAVSRALRQLEAEQLIQRSSGDQDKRTKSVVMTETGKTRLLGSLDHARANADHFRAKLDAEEFRTLQSLLSKLRQDEKEGLSHL